MDPMQTLSSDLNFNDASCNPPPLIPAKSIIELAAEQTDIKRASPFLGESDLNFEGIAGFPSLLCGVAIGSESPQNSAQPCVASRIVSSSAAQICNTQSSVDAKAVHKPDNQRVATAITGNPYPWPSVVASTAQDLTLPKMHHNFSHPSSGLNGNPHMPPLSPMQSPFLPSLTGPGLMTGMDMLPPMSSLTQSSMSIPSLESFHMDMNDVAATSLSSCLPFTRHDLSGMATISSSISNLSPSDLNMMNTVSMLDGSVMQPMLSTSLASQAISRAPPSFYSHFPMPLQSVSSASAGYSLPPMRMDPSQLLSIHGVDDTSLPDEMSVLSSGSSSLVQTGHPGSAEASHYLNTVPNKSYYHSPSPLNQPIEAASNFKIPPVAQSKYSPQPVSSNEHHSTSQQMSPSAHRNVASGSSRNASSIPPVPPSLKKTSKPVLMEGIPLSIQKTAISPCQSKVQQLPPHSSPHTASQASPQHPCTPNATTNSEAPMNPPQSLPTYAPVPSPQEVVTNANSAASFHSTITCHILFKISRPVQQKTRQDLAVIGKCLTGLCDPQGSKETVIFDGWAVRMLVRGKVVQQLKPIMEKLMALVKKPQFINKISSDMAEGIKSIDLSQLGEGTFTVVGDYLRCIKLPVGIGTASRIRSNVVQRPTQANVPSPFKSPRSSLPAPRMAMSPSVVRSPSPSVVALSPNNSLSGQVSPSVVCVSPSSRSESSRTSSQSSNQPSGLHISLPPTSPSLSCSGDQLSAGATQCLLPAPSAVTENLATSSPLLCPTVQEKDLPENYQGRSSITSNFSSSSYSPASSVGGRTLSGIPLISSPDAEVESGECNLDESKVSPPNDATVASSADDVPSSVAEPVAQATGMLTAQEKIDVQRHCPQSVKVSIIRLEQCQRFLKLKALDCDQFRAPKNINRLFEDLNESYLPFQKHLIKACPPLKLKITTPRPGRKKKSEDDLDFMIGKDAGKNGKRKKRRKIAGFADEDGDEIAEKEIPRQGTQKRKASQSAAQAVQCMLLDAEDEDEHEISYIPTDDNESEDSFVDSSDESWDEMISAGDRVPKSIRPQCSSPEPVTEEQRQNSLERLKQLRKLKKGKSSNDLESAGERDCSNTDSNPFECDTNVNSQVSSPLADINDLDSPSNILTSDQNRVNQQNFSQCQTSRLASGTDSLDSENFQKPTENQTDHSDSDSSDDKSDDDSSISKAVQEIVDTLNCGTNLHFDSAIKASAEPKQDVDTSPSKSEQDGDTSPSKSEQGSDTSDAKYEQGSDTSDAKYEQGGDTSSFKSEQGGETSASKSEQSGETSSSKSEQDGDISAAKYGQDVDHHGALDFSSEKARPTSPHNLCKFQGKLGQLQGNDVES